MKILEVLAFGLVLAGVVTDGSVSSGNSNDLVINVGVADSAEDGFDAAGAAAPPPPAAAIYKQIVSGNSSTDTVTLEYQEPDGTIVTQLTDFRMQTQVTRVMMLGEEELEEPAHQVVCFVSAFTGDMIPPEAVMKLRQKHPGTVRIAESDEGEVVQDSQYLFKYSGKGNSYHISSHLAGLCKDAKQTTYTSSHELHTILTEAKKPVSLMDTLVAKFPDYESLPRCAAAALEKDDDGGLHRFLSDGGSSCQCTIQVMFNWYPCSLKYCRNQDGEGEHRCGIKTCRKTLTFRYPVRSTHLCKWDEM